MHPELCALPTTPYDARRSPVDVIDEITVQHEEAAAIRTLPAQHDLACLCAQ